MSKESPVMDVRLEKIDKEKQLVRKSNKFNEARYPIKLNPTESKIYALLISMIHPDDKDFKKYRFKITELSDFLGIDRKHAYEDLPKVSESLMKKVCKIEEETGFLQVALLSSARYHIGEGLLDLEFSPELKPYLLELRERYVKHHLSFIIILNSSYSMRIYELLKQYEKIGRRRIKIEDLREMLGVKPDEYKRYNDFKKRILEPVKKEIPDKTDIKFDFKEIKTGRKITDIEFIIYPNPDWNKDVKPKPLPELEEVPEEEPEIKEIKGIFFCLSCQKKFDKCKEQKHIEGFFIPVCPYCKQRYIIKPAKVPLKPEVLKEFLKMHKPERLYNTIDIIDFQKDNGKQIESYQKYLMTLLIKGVIEPEGYKTPDERLKDELERNKRHEEERKQKEAYEKQLELEKKAGNYIKELPDDELKALTEQAIKQIDPSIQENLKIKDKDDIRKMTADISLKLEMQKIVEETVFKKEI
jgi:DNA-directed RNA polymerase subunit RPC12/RpoP